MEKHCIKAAFAGGMAFESEINGHKLITDTTAENGGNNTGPSPKRLMLSSLAGCTGIDIADILGKMRVHFTDFSIEIEATLTEEHPKIYNKVTVIYKIKLPEEDKPKMERAVSLSEDKYCGVMAMFRAFAEVKTQITYL